MTGSELTTTTRSSRGGRPARPAEIVCAAGLIVGVVASYLLLAATPSLLAHHVVLLEALNANTAAIVTAGAFARVGREPLLLVVVAPLTTVATYDVFVWWAGRLWGHQLVAGYTSRSRRARRWVDRAERLVRRRGVLAVALAYYLPVPNPLIYLLCGVSEMPLVWFVVGDIIGNLLWEGLVIGLGWTIGHPAIRVVQVIGHYSIAVTVGLVVLLLLFAAVRRQRGDQP